MTDRTDGSEKQADKAADKPAGNASVESGTKLLTSIDNIDDRREVLILLQKLTARERIEFLHWAMETANANIKLRHRPPWTLVVITSASGEPTETYLDLMMMVNNFALSLKSVLPELERRVAKARLLWLG